MKFKKLSTVKNEDNKLYTVLYYAVEENSQNEFVVYESIAFNMKDIRVYVMPKNEFEDSFTLVYEPQYMPMITMEDENE